MSERGLINVETTLNLKNLMEMSGHVQFIQFIVQVRLILRKFFRP